MSALHPFWLGSTPLILASASPVRRQILAGAGIPVETMPAGIDERFIEAGLMDATGADIALALATAKALSVQAEPGRLVLGADQTLALGLRLFHKPGNRSEAAQHLAAMSGLTHHLHSAQALVRGGSVLWSHVDTATITFRQFSPAFIERYLDAVGTSALASVGSYQVEALGPHLMEQTDGSHSTILGLPLIPLLQHLRVLGLVPA